MSAPKRDYRAEEAVALAGVLSRSDWHVEVAWCEPGAVAWCKAGWYTAHLVSQFGTLAPVSKPLVASGPTPDEAIANLNVAVAERQRAMRVAGRPMADPRMSGPLCLPGDC